MADQTVRFLPVTGNDNQTVLEVVLFEHDAKLGAMSYAILTTDIKGTPLLNLSNGASIVMTMNEAGELQLNYVFLEGRNVVQVMLQDIRPANRQSVHVREGDGGGVHIGWLEGDRKTLGYAYVDGITRECCQVSARYVFKEPLQLPPPFYLTPHVLVGRQQVVVLSMKRASSNPVVNIDVFRVEKGRSMSDTIGVGGGNAKVGDDVLRDEKPTDIGGKRLRLISSGIEVGTPLQPQGDHAWYGGTYLSLGYHVPDESTALELRRVAVILGESATDLYHDVRSIASNVSLLSNLTPPINSYQGAMGRGGLAWLEARPGHKVFLTLFRDTTLDVSHALNADVAGSIAVSGGGRGTLYWIDQGPQFLPIVFVLASNQELYQFDLEDPEEFSVMPARNPVRNAVIWTGITANEEYGIAVVATLDSRGAVSELFNLKRNWRGMELEYVWEPVQER
ncbi:MAG TPA: hypothetical protein EYN93_07375 [Planctomycetaceae bacterium]|nr:hypothetical protein [Planctomycetaceae bacterium]